MSERPDSPRATSGAGPWLGILRRYVMFIVLANLLWEVAHLPLYTIWREGSLAEIVFAVAHCTGGDILIASTALLVALLAVGNHHWPDERYLAVAAFAVAVGFGYTAFSEWFNTTVRQSWAYTEFMPTLPGVAIGLSPLAQWIIVPLAAFWFSRRRTWSHTQVTERAP